MLALATSLAHKTSHEEIIDILKNQSLHSVETDSGKNILHFVCSIDNEQLLRSILSLSVDCNALDNSQNSPLHIAAQTNIKLVKELVTAYFFSFSC